MTISASQQRSIIACLLKLAQIRGVQTPLGMTFPSFTDISVFNDQIFIDHAAAVGFEAEKISTRLVELISGGRINFPCITILKNGNAVLLLEFDTARQTIALIDPLADQGATISITLDKFERAWDESVWELSLLEKLSNSSQNKDATTWLKLELEKHKKFFISIVLAGFFVNIFSLISPFFLMIVLDKVVQFKAWTTLTVLGIGALIVVVFESLFDYLKNLFNVKVSKELDWSLQTDIFSHFLHLPINHIRNGQKGVWSRNLLEIEKVRGFITSRALMIGLDMAFVFIFAIAMCWINPFLLLIVLAGSFVQFVLGIFITPLIKHRIYQNFHTEGLRDGLLSESIASIDMVKSLGIERLMYAKWRNIISGTLENRFQLQSLLTANKSLSGFVDKITSIAIIWVGATLVIKGDASVGALVACNILARRITGPIVQLVSFLQDIHEVKASIRVVDEIFSLSTEMNECNKERLILPITAHFTFEQVYFQYRDNNSFQLFLEGEIPPGALVGVVGGSGSGKSTFAKMLLGLEMPISGVLRVDGHDIKNLNFENYRNQIGTVLQDFCLIKGSVRENILIGNPSASMADVVNAAKLAGADDFIQRLPNGYDTALYEAAANLSGGQKQRIALARALVRNPKLLIFDEVTSALDPESEAVIMNNLDKMRYGRTVVMITHRLSSVVGADLILYMEAGQIRAQGTHSELMKSCQGYKDLYRAQSLDITK